MLDTLVKIGGPLGSFDPPPSLSSVNQGTKFAMASIAKPNKLL